jgi:UDP-N-acetylmuramate dehydrogenase
MTMTFTDFRGEVRLQEPLSRHTSFRIGGPADILALPADRHDLAVLLREIKAQGRPSIILGGGTNLLVKDGGFRGVVISLERLRTLSLEREYRSIGGSYGVIAAEAGVPLPLLLNFTADQGYTGFEFAAGIPGTVGGAICMNAGTARGEIGDVVESVALLSPAGETVTRSGEQMEFGYRTAKVPAGHVVVQVRAVLRKGEKDKIREEVRELLATRNQHQPWGLPSAGSVFKNPLDESAGRLIEKAGLKGRRVGGAEVSEKHANFIVNRGSATAADVMALMKIIQDAVLDMHQIRLEPEIKIVGEE